MKYFGLDSYPQYPENRIKYFGVESYP
jgi:hypothetical protein